MFMVYNILHVGLQPPMLLHQQLSSITTSNCLNLMLKRLFVVTFFLIRAVNVWNQLPNEMVTSNLATSFKIKLDNYYF